MQQVKRPDAAISTHSVETLHFVNGVTKKTMQRGDSAKNAAQAVRMVPVWGPCGQV